MIPTILVATISWFVVALLLFFNPVMDKIYASTSNHASVKQLPKSAATMGKIIFAIFIQCVLWAFIYQWIVSTLDGSWISKGLLFGTIICFIKMIPRDIDRLLLTTYPTKRMLIEFVIGAICSYVVAFVFAYFIN